MGPTSHCARINQPPPGPPSPLATCCRRQHKLARFFLGHRTCGGCSRKLRERVLLKNSCSIDHQHDKTIADHQPLTTANDKTIADHQPLTTANDKNDKTIADHQPLTTANDKTMRRSAEKICWEDLLRKSAEKICWENLLRENLLRRSAEKICWEDLLKKICWEDLLRKSAEKICWEDLLRRSAEKICWEDLLRRSAEKICWRKSAEKICWEDLLKKSAEKICWEWLWIKTSLKFLSFFTQGGFGRSRRETTLSSLRAHRTSKTEVKCEFCTSSRNPLVVSCSSDVQNWGEMRILYLVVATLSSFRAHRTSKTEVNCESAWVVGQPYRRFVLIGRPKLWWNANLWLRSWTLSSLRAGQMSETVVKCWFLYAAGCPGRRALDSYILAHAAVVKRTFWNFGWHAVVARRTFCFFWMNPLVGFGGSMARNCGETQIFYGNCRRLRAKRSFWKLCSMKIWGSLARNARFGSLFCEIWRKSRAKRSFLKLVLWNFEEASHETIVLEAFSVKIAGSIVRNARFGSLFCEISKKHRTKRSFWKLFLWKLSEASRETLVLEACSVKFRGSLARNDRFRLWNLVLVAAFSY